MVAILPLIGPIIQGASGLVGKIFGNKEAKDQQIHNEQTSVQEGYQAEYIAPEKTSWFGQFVDGSNRLVRPFFTFGTISLFIWCVHDPVSFTTAMIALQAMPENLWYIMLAIVTFWFGSRVVDKWQNNGLKTVTKEQLGTILKQQEEIGSLSKTNEYTEDKYQKELKDITKPLSNNAILEWNKRNLKKDK